MPSRNQRVACVVALSTENDTEAGRFMKLPYDLGDPTARVFHQVFRAHATRECRLFDLSHLIISYHHGQLGLAVPRMPPNLHRRRKMAPRRRTCLRAASSAHGKSLARAALMLNSKGRLSEKISQAIGKRLMQGRVVLSAQLRKMLESLALLGIQPRGHLDLNAS